MAPRAQANKEGSDVVDNNDDIVQAVAQSAADANQGKLPDNVGRPDPGAGDVKVTGVNQAFVNTKPLVSGQPPVVVEVREGETLPGNLIAGEHERLDALGVFGPHPREARAAAMAAARAAMGDGSLPIAEPDTAAIIAAVERTRAEHNASERRDTGIDPDAVPE